jgi:hypothetical protein
MIIFTGICITTLALLTFGYVIIATIDEYQEISEKQEQIYKEN